MNKFRRRYPLLFAVAALLLATPLLIAATSGKSGARRVALQCGDAVSTSVVLTADLGPCGGDGLDVNANGITINLNGHTIKGSNVGAGVNDTGHTGVTITNGTITNFPDGVFFGGANGSRAQGLRVTGSTEAGVLDSGSSNVVVSGNYVLASAIGIYVVVGSGVQVTGNWVESDNSYGILVNHSTGVVVSQNRTLNNTGPGITFGDGSTGQLTGNIANGNGSDGIRETTGFGVTVTGNRASFDTGYGIKTTAGVKDGGGNVVQDNAASAQCSNIVCAEVSN